MIRYLVLILLFGLFQTSLSQEKVEIEKSLKANLVPEMAKQLVCELFPEGKIRWISEISNTATNIEAKVKVKRKRFSVEFKESGEFEDVEETIKKSEIDSIVLVKIEKQFEIDFDKYRIKKIQHHYSGNKTEVAKIYTNQKVDYNQIKQLYEIVVFAQKNREQNSFEYTFSINGEFVQKLKNAEVNTDNLLF